MPLRSGAISPLTFKAASENKLNFTKPITASTVKMSNVATGSNEEIEEKI
jgi:hypothetical protein